MYKMNDYWWMHRIELILWLTLIDLYLNEKTGASAYVDEYFNFNHGRGKLVVTADGTRTTFVYDNTTNQLMQFSGMFEFCRLCSP